MNSDSVIVIVVFMVIYIYGIYLLNLPRQNKFI